MGAMDFENISPEALRQYQQQNEEGDYQLIDVRQPDEYEAGHIPGSRLMPLDELEEQVSSLPPSQDIVFYCRSGARSQAAAIISLDENPALQKVFNLAGGFMAWGGHALRNYPRAEGFETDASMAGLMHRSMDLEKAAEQFYEAMHERYADKTFAPTIDKLSKAEKAHARVIYTYWKRSVDAPEPFDDLYRSLPGRILEGGEPLRNVVERWQAASEQSCIDLFELALHIEIQAYDLYRTMADRESAAEAREAFLSIAQMEKKHMQMLSKALGQC